MLPFCSIPGDVMFPAYVKVNRSIETLRAGFLETVRQVTLITVPVGLGIALTARPLVFILFSEKGADAIVRCRLSLAIAGRMLHIPLRRIGTALQPAIVAGIGLTVAVSGILEATGSLQRLRTVLGKNLSGTMVDAGQSGKLDA